MPLYKYIAKDQYGRTFVDTVEAKTQSQVIDSLRKRSLVIISVQEQKAKAAGFGKKKIKMDDLVIFSRQLSTMVDAGIPLTQGLDIMAEQVENVTFKDVISRVRNEVETGSSLSDALAKNSKVFSGLFVNMVRAGESSGMLDDILERLAGYLEKTNALARKVRSALVYPSVVTSMAFIITLVLVLKVIPGFKDIFSTLGVELPTPTVILLKISDVTRKYFVIVGGLIGAAIFLLTRYINTPSGRLAFDKLKLRVPVFGILFRKVAIAKFSRTLATLVKSGVPILNALEIVGKTSGNKVVERAVESVRTSIREGENIAEPLAKSGAFPPMVVRMISVGEQSGELEKMLTKIADFYDEQVEAAVSGLTSMIEPLIIAFLGIVIGSIVVSMFLPILKLSQIVSR